MTAGGAEFPVLKTSGGALEAIEPHMMSLLRDPDSTDYLVVSASHNGSAFVLARMKEK